ncbi:hypothetical protein BJY04DRAFT_213985 [Aspergillus karnatakaensis]|uniref:uncharacterized protein n=1 Tax=Aspergillus karnatakaensis TaxID=1810916 RepID=UPI003CCD5E14
MRDICAIALLLSTCAVNVQGRTDSTYDPASNFRPNNITGLDYYHYTWIGSYYNGSVTFTISDLRFRDPELYEDEGVELCDQLQGYSYFFSYPGILAVTKTESEEERPQNKNPINLRLTTSYSNFTEHQTNLSDVNSPEDQFKDQPWIFESINFLCVPSAPVPVSCRRDSRLLGVVHVGLLSIQINICLSVNSVSPNAPFHVHGTSNLTVAPSIEPWHTNMSTCARNEAWWIAGFWGASDFGALPEITDPTLSLTF